MKPLPGHPEYLVSRDGEVFSTKSQRNLVLRTNPFGYLRVGLTEKNKQKGYMVHRLVASAYIPNPMKKPQINHKDGDRKNNRVENLEWVTPKENIAHGIASGRIKVRGVDNKAAKMTPAFIKKAAKLLHGKNVGEKRKIYKVLTKESGTTREAIWQAVTGRTWSYPAPVLITEAKSRKK